MRHDYPKMFEKLLWDNCRDLLDSGWARNRNFGAPFGFGEAQLRKHIQTAIRNGTYVLPTDWPDLLIERKVDCDRSEVGHRHGAVDYVFGPQGCAGKPNLTDLFATYEVGGPTRPKLLEGSKDNWYPKILKDIEKQCWRARYAPTVEHFVAVFVQPRLCNDVHADFYAVLQTMLKSVSGAQAGEVLWSERPPIANLFLAIFQITPRE